MRPFLMFAACLLVLSATVSAQSLDVRGLQALEESPPQADGPLNLAGLDQLAKKPASVEGFNLLQLQSLEKPAPLQAVFNPFAAEGWGCDAYMPTWCGHCTDMQGAEEPKALATGFPLHCIKGDEQQFPAWVVASANSSQAKGWPLIHVYNRKTGVAVQTWGKRTIEQLAELIEWAKQRPVPQAVAPPQTSLPVQVQQPAAVSPVRCNKRRCLSLYGEDRPAWV